jgi:hypothetical protein
MPVMASSGQGSESVNAQLLVDSIPALIHTARPDGYLDYSNRPWLEYLGVTLDKGTGWNWTAFVHPEDVEGSGQVASLPRDWGNLRVRNSRPQSKWRIPLDVPPGKCHFAIQTATSSSGMDPAWILRNAGRRRKPSETVRRTWRKPKGSVTRAASGGDLIPERLSGQTKPIASSSTTALSSQQGATDFEHYLSFVAA